jgi:geranylgeranyl diphosphate synthase type I
MREEDDMLEAFKTRRLEIEAYLEELFTIKKAEFGKINKLGEDVCDRLRRFATEGKMIRGLLVSLGYALFNGDEEGQSVRRSLIETGAAMELFQSALLIHDDIMDRDQKRRGLESIYHQYSRLPELKDSEDAYHFGESLGICAGDVSFFLGFEILSKLDVRSDIYRSILSLASKEIGYVGVAQMQDVINGANRLPVSEDEILKLYMYKTGRYTFSLPLMVGGLLADVSQETVETLGRLGESLGIIFQLKDDELGIYGKPDVIGKPPGSDIREGKKTLFYGYLRKLASAEQNQQMDGIFGNRDIGAEEITFVQKLAEKLGVRELVDSKIGEHADKTRALIEALQGSVGKYRDSLEHVLEYSLARAS